MFEKAKDFFGSIGIGKGALFAGMLLGAICLLWYFGSLFFRDIWGFLAIFMVGSVNGYVLAKTGVVKEFLDSFGEKL